MPLWCDSTWSGNPKISLLGTKTNHVQCTFALSDPNSWYPFPSQYQSTTQR